MILFKKKLDVCVIMLLFIASSSFSADKKIYVSNKYKEHQDGSLNFPFSSINQATEIAFPGDTIFVLEGVYRERVIPIRSGEPGKPIVFFGEPGKKVVIKGSDIWQPQWNYEGEGVYSAVPEEKLFNDLPSDYPDHHNPFKVNLSSTPYQRQGKRELERGYGGDSTLVYTCGQVFVNGKQFLEVPFKKELSPNSWYYEPETEKIYIHFGNLKPQNQEVEISTRRRIFAPVKRNLGYITVEGFLMEHCGNQYPTNFWINDVWAQKGALGLQAGHQWVIKRNVIRHVKTFAIDAGHVDLNGDKYEAHDNIIEENYILENGSAGILSNSSENMIIRNNVLLRNNTMKFWGRKRWEQAAIKCHHAKNGYIHNNYISDNYLTYGVWLDNHFPDSRVSRNVIVNNGKSGIFLEMSDYGFDRLFIDNNIIVGNAQNPIYCHDASGATIMHNLLANTPTQETFGQGYFVRQVRPRTKTYHHSLYNNILAGSRAVLDFNYPSHRSGKQRIDFNVYDVNMNDKVFCINKTSDDPSPWSNQEFYKLIEKELAIYDDLVAFEDKGHVALTFKQWQTFWENHDCPNDKNSKIHKGIQVSYLPELQELVVIMPIAPKKMKSKDHDFVDVDFWNQDIPQNGYALPGPFQNLKQGKNRFKVWKGLKVLGENELPDFSKFHILKSKKV
ncbi:right-handed parallel beta-helix repeat-containing protein [Tamlana fucoidanivorans]|uniref:Right-handed parallel beta-helix repeat-containing protein n=1 Tax=Allotamlana fucoidanivorans TaxID=2583814 RepID=A0A5C4SDP0_9FLAO|nr:right-handed parallel beta-helix repeat-containing protein [Tamlana fucoidanivorans]TNJ41497.1 right-handed parallel beta-helix repeat-containing protein [Tamlana fucoidanivorans]